MDLLPSLLNRLLDTDPDGRARLAAFAGRTVELNLPGLPRLRTTLTVDGRFERSPHEAPATVHIRAGAEALTRWLAEGRLRAGDFLEYDGDADLGALLLDRIDQSPWMVEEWLSRGLGDVAANRFSAGVRAFAGWHRDSARRLVDSFAAWAVDEGALVVTRSEMRAHARGVADLVAALDRIEQSIRTRTGVR